MDEMAMIETVIIAINLGLCNVYDRFALAITKLCKLLAKLALIWLFLGGLESYKLSGAQKHLYVAT